MHGQTSQVWTLLLRRRVLDRDRGGQSQHTVSVSSACAAAAASVSSLDQEVPNQAI